MTISDKPQGADWRGTNLSQKDAGYVMARTFDVEGRYEYFCQPHESQGMTGTLVVSEETGSPTETGDGNGTTTGTGTTVDGSGDDGGGGDY